MKQSFENFSRILNRSKEFTFESHTTLVLTDYHTGEEIRLDLSRITPEMFAELSKGDPLQEIWERCVERIDNWNYRALQALEKIDHNRCSFERADRDLYNEIQGQIEEYYHEEELYYVDWEQVSPSDVLYYDGD